MKRFLFFMVFCVLASCAMTPVFAISNDGGNLFATKLQIYTEEVSTLPSTVSPETMYIANKIAGLYFWEIFLLAIPLFIILAYLFVILKTCKSAYPELCKILRRINENSARFVGIQEAILTKLANTSKSGAQSSTKKRD